MHVFQSSRHKTEFFGMQDSVCKKRISSRVSHRRPGVGETGGVEGHGRGMEEMSRVVEGHGRGRVEGHGRGGVEGHGSSLLSLSLRSDPTSSGGKCVCVVWLREERVSEGYP